MVDWFRELDPAPGVLVADGHADIVPVGTLVGLR